jgi:hypothetical protein
MKVRYNPFVGVVALVIGAICEFLGLWLLLLGAFSPSVVLGLLPMLLGLLYLLRPYFWVHSKYVVIPALVGPATREVPYQRLELDGGKLVAVGEDGTRKKVPVTRWMAHSGDWAALMAERSTPAGQ